MEFFALWQPSARSLNYGRGGDPESLGKGMMTYDCLAIW